MALLLIIQGPTASGKTNVAIQLAQHFNSVIISADSRQVYQEMTIGTAVPSNEELQSIHHFCIQHKSIQQLYTTGDYEKEVIALLDILFQKHELVILCGGTGLYIDAIVKGLDNIPSVSEQSRLKACLIFEDHGLEGIQKFIQENDPEYWAEVDTFNHRRLIRAAEVIIETSKPYASFLKKNTFHRSFDTFYITLEWERALLYERINARVDKMLQDGLLNEVNELYPHRHLSALQTVGYQEFFDWKDGKISFEEAVELVKRNSRRYAKRQMTWFRRTENNHYFHPNQIDKMIQSLKECFKN